MWDDSSLWFWFALPCLMLSDMGYLFRNSLMVQRLGLHTFTAERLGSILVGELRSLKPHSSAKKRKRLKKKNPKQTQNHLFMYLLSIWMSSLEKHPFRSTAHFKITFFFCFHVLAIINSAAMNIGVHVSLSDLVSSVCMPRSGIAGSYIWLLFSCYEFFIV